MYVVRRSFRGPHGPMSAGSVVEPATVRNFRYRLQEKHIVEVTEHNFERYSDFFKQRFGVVIPSLVDPEPAKHTVAVAQVVVKPATPVEPEVPQEEAAPVEPEVPQEAPEAPQEEVAPVKLEASKAKSKAVTAKAK